MMRDMVLRGPEPFDALFVYESVVIDYLKSAEGRWGELRVVYPQHNMWNDNPYYILDAPWSSADQRKAAGAFLDFLLSEPVQKQSLEHGFRPGNPEVPIKFAGQPLRRIPALRPAGRHRRDLRGAARRGAEQPAGLVAARAGALGAHDQPVCPGQHGHRPSLAARRADRPQGPRERPSGSRPTRS